MSGDDVLAVLQHRIEAIAVQHAALVARLEDSTSAADRTAIEELERRQGQVLKSGSSAGKRRRSTLTRLINPLASNVPTQTKTAKTSTLELEALDKAISEAKDRFAAAHEARRRLVAQLSDLHDLAFGQDLELTTENEAQLALQVTLRAHHDALETQAIAEEVFRELLTATRQLERALGVASNALGVATKEFQAHRGLSNAAVRALHLKEATSLAQYGYEHHQLARALSPRPLSRLPLPEFLDEVSLFGDSLHRAAADLPVGRDNLKEGLLSLVRIDKKDANEDMRQGAALLKQVHSLALLQTSAQIAVVKAAKEATQRTVTAVEGAQERLLYLRIDAISKPAGAAVRRRVEQADEKPPAY